MEQKWPQEIWLVRHGQSAGNVARDAAEAAAGHLIDIAERDVDVPLSELGVRQSQALGDWFASPARRASAPTWCCIRPTCARPKPRASSSTRIGARHADGRPGRRAPARKGIRHPRPPDHARHRPQISRAVRAAPARRQVLFPPARRRKLVRRHPAPAQRARHHHARILQRAGADRRPPGHGQLLPLPVRAPRRSADPRHSTAPATCRTARSPPTRSIRTHGQARQAGAAT